MGKWKEKKKDLSMKPMHLHHNGTARPVIAAVLVLSVVLASFTGCRDKKTVETEAPTTTETTVSPTPTNTPTPTNSPTPSPTPVIPHMDAPEVDTKAPMFLNLPETAWVANGNEFYINLYVGFIDDCDSDV